MLKRNYTRLCDCLPLDCRKIIKKIKEVCEFPDNDDMLSKTINLLCCCERTEAIFAVLVIVKMKSDVHALFICDCVAEMLGDENLKSVVETVRNGKFSIMTTL